MLQKKETKQEKKSYNYYNRMNCYDSFQSITLSRSNTRIEVSVSGSETARPIFPRRQPVAFFRRTVDTNSFLSIVRVASIAHRSPVYTRSSSFFYTCTRAPRSPARACTLAGGSHAFVQSTKADHHVLQACPVSRIIMKKKKKGKKKKKDAVFCSYWTS